MPQLVVAERRGHRVEHGFDPSMDWIGLGGMAVTLFSW